MPTVGQFHRLWSDLHRRPAQMSAGEEHAWLDRFTRRIPCDGCRRHWRELLRKLPPDLSTPARYFAWTVRAHNEVNRWLGKRPMPLTAAKRLWVAHASRVPVKVSRLHELRKTNSETMKQRN